ncbi:PIR protein [Plasmodium yoelii]|uniref:PIR protein n=3 Tax=Plasmodium yoelii TaxID=5861 RepID=A0AAE9WT95_PLAYO|nr:PIR protein [Plasmodium yoelii]XP_034493639.1 PIR protein [Plasmodium yoelii]EAA19370.1 putative yir4 protein [Plasmodium yoelii yoelii]EAA21140.1 putative yir4 protein [Plasmodium yoelii yoelii]WBY56179.1 PIR protein [Plasmodium yoelii yoelii]WBY61380.1 PIR protein [Plasmodium yoelii yoelii]CDS44353.1 YIR protein [Plasmodium yoelii]|eukprot:XP_034493442.1 PIR protein [Plasmodium yoelii]
MNKQVCEKFENLWDKFSDKLDSDNNYIFQKENFLDGYCGSNSCDTDFEKINGGCLYLFNKIFGTSELFKSVANSNINIVEYIMIWLSYMLNLKEQTGSDSNLQFFYSTTIDNDRYKNSIADVTEYKHYKDLIDKKKEFMDISSEKITKLYVLFKSLCNMYTGLNEKNPDCTKYITTANEFVKKYQELYGDSDNTGSSLYRKILHNLSTDYSNFKKKCKNSSSFPSIEATNNFIRTSELTSTQTYEDTPSSSSITTRLFTVLSIFGAIAFFLGISYKYSLFGFRKRFKKQQIREKIKNIKKKMNQ